MGLELVDCRFFLDRFPVCLNIFVFLFLVTPCLVVAVQPCIEWIPIKKNSLDSILDSIDSLVTHVRHPILNSYYDHMEDVRFYSPDYFFFLRFIFDIFNISYFCYLKSKFWDGFFSKISFWLLHTSHENGPIMVRLSEGRFLFVFAEASN